MIRNIVNRLSGVNGILLILYMGIVSFLDICLMDIDEIINIPRDFLVVMLLLVAFCPYIIKEVNKKRIVSAQNYPNEQKEALKWRILFFLIPFILFMFYFAVFFPGGFSWDSFYQYNQSVANQYNDWHPVLHTLLTFKLPLLLSDGWPGSIVLFQIIIFSVVLSYSMYTVYRYTNIKFAVFSLMFIVTNPQISVLTMFPWKDIAFAITVLLMMTYVMNVMFTKGNWIKKPVNAGCFIIVTAVTTILRHNAILFVAVMFVAIFFLIPKKKFFVILLGVAILVAGIKGPVYSLLQVEKPDQRQVEMLGLPMTVIGAVAKYDYESLDEETKVFVDKVAPRVTWDSYEYGNYNGVKFGANTNNLVLEDYGVKTVLIMAVKSFINSPMHALRGLLTLVSVSYSVLDRYDHFLAPYMDNGNSEITSMHKTNTMIVSIVTKINCAIQKVFSFVFMQTGIFHLILVISVLAKCKLNKLKDWKKILLVLPAFAYNFGTTVLLTGAEDSYRFFYYTALLMPIFLVILFRDDDEKEEMKSI